MINRETCYKKIVNFVKDYDADDTAIADIELQKRSLEDDLLKKNQYDSWAKISGSLKNIGLHSMCESANLFLVNDYVAALDTLKEAYAYNCLSFRVNLLLRLKQKNLYTHCYSYNVNYLVGLLSVAILFDDKPMLFIINRLLDIVEEYDFSEALSFDMLYKRYVQSLANIHIDSAPCFQYEETSYGKIFKYWNDEDKLSSAIEGALDYHLGLAAEQGKYYDEHCSFVDEKWFYSSPFFYAGNMILPYEIIALYKVRKSKGLFCPKVDHILLSEKLLEAFDNNLELDYEDDYLNEINSNNAFLSAEEIFEEMTN